MSAFEDGFMDELEKVALLSEFARKAGEAAGKGAKRVLTAPKRIFGAAKEGWKKGWQESAAARDTKSKPPVPPTASSAAKPAPKQGGSRPLPQWARKMTPMAGMTSNLDLRPRQDVPLAGGAGIWKREKPKESADQRGLRLDREGDARGAKRRGDNMLDIWKKQHGG